jgi:hypothetical protein
MNNEPKYLPWARRVRLVEWSFRGRPYVLTTWVCSSAALPLVEVTRCIRNPDSTEAKASVGCSNISNLRKSPRPGGKNFHIKRDMRGAKEKQEGPYSVCRKLIPYILISISFVAIDFESNMVFYQLWSPVNLSNYFCCIVFTMHARHSCLS